MWVVVFRRWYHNFKMYIIKYSGFWLKIPISVLYIVDLSRSFS